MQKQTKIKLSLFVLALLFICSFVIFSVIKAGSITPPSQAFLNGLPIDTMHSLEEIYGKLNNISSGFVYPGYTKLKPTASPGATMYTLDDIYNSIPTIDPTTVLTGTTYLGIAGTATAGTPPFAWGDQASAQNDWYTADSYCTAMTDGGYTWRLPTLGELLKGLSDQFVSATETGFTSGNEYWSSSVNGSDYPSAAKYDGTTISYRNIPKFIGSVSVRCVH